MLTARRADPLGRSFVSMSEFDTLPVSFMPSVSGVVVQLNVIEVDHFQITVHVSTRPSTTIFCVTILLRINPMSAPPRLHFKTQTPMDWKASERDTVSCVVPHGRTDFNNNPCLTIAADRSIQMRAR